MKPDLILAGMVAIGCATQASPDTTATDGRTLFLAHCAECHLPEVADEGDASSGLARPAPDLARIAQRRDGVWPMLEIMSIVEGYAALDHLRDGMPVIADIVEGPTIDFDTGNGLVVATPLRLVALVEYLESIQSPPPERYVP